MLAFNIGASLSIGLSVSSFVMYVARRQTLKRQAAAMRRMLDFTSDATETAEKPPGFFDVFAEPLKKTRWGAKLAADYERSGQKGSFSQHIQAMILFAIIGCMVGIFYLNRPVLAVVLTIVGAFVPVFYTNIKVSQHQTKINKQLNEVLMLITGSLRAGNSLPQAFETVVTEAEAPLNEAFMVILRDIKLGSTIDAALERSTRRVPGENFRLVVQAITTIRQSGGNIPEMLDKLGNTMRERLQLQSEADNATAQQRLSVNIISAMPIVTGALMYSRDATYFNPLLSSSGGVLLLMFSVALWVAGYLICRRIAAIRI